MRSALTAVILRSYDQDATDWARRVAANGGSVSRPTQAAVSRFCASAKANGYWSKVNRLNLFCGEQLSASIVPQKVGNGNSTDTSMNFVAGDYSETSGLTSDGTTKYLRTGFIPSTTTAQNDSHLAMYNRGSTAQRCTIGCDNGAGNIMQFLCPFNGSLVDSYLYNGTVGAGLNEQANPGAPLRLMITTRTAGNVHTIYKDGSSLGVAATTGGGPPNIEIYVLASNASATPAFVNQAPCGGYSIGSGLTAADALAYSRDMQAFQAAIGRSI